MEWFKKRLNIALLTTLIICNGIAFWGYWGIGGGVLILVILAIILIIGVEIWYLRQKERSLFNLLWNLLPYAGFVMILLLDNDRQKQLKAESNTTLPPPTAQ